MQHGIYSSLIFCKIFKFWHMKTRFLTDNSTIFEKNTKTAFSFVKSIILSTFLSKIDHFLGVQIVHNLYTPPGTIEITFKTRIFQNTKVLPCVFLQKNAKSEWFKDGGDFAFSPSKKRKKISEKFTRTPFRVYSTPPQPHGGPPSKRLPRVLFRYRQRPF